MTADGPWLLKFCPACGQRNDNADKCTNDRAHPGRQPWLVREPVVLESRLREAAASFNELAAYLHPLPAGGHARLGEACGVDACILCLAETRAKEARDRARGVLGKDTGG
jgi:hypothetical protein